ncbi:MAG: ParB N-terminal domain-containing protein [Patescibacteria group bacterium]|nr:ParB N-terminal domain-containing protein [Patescibacteria group bacterium]
MIIHSIPIDQIQIPSNRQRRTFDEGELQQLASSIERIGLLHSIVLRQKEGQFFLVAGERRLRAVRDIWELGGTYNYNSIPVPHGQIAYSLLGELSPLEAMEAELEENIRRVDLSWQEKAEATARLAKFRQTQAESLGSPPPTVADLSEEIRGSREGAYQETTRKELILAKHLDDPDVKAAKSAKDAFKILKWKEQNKRYHDLGQTVGKTFSKTQHQIVLADSIDWMANQPIEQFDVILTDPPYGINAESFGDSNGRVPAGHMYDDSPETWQANMPRLAAEFYRLAKPDAHLYFFLDVENFLSARAALSSAGWRVFRTPLIWHKPTGFRAPWPEHGPQRKYEMILYAVKGDRKVNQLYSDIITIPGEENLGHAAQKPVALFQELLRRSTRPGDKVWDPFCGSGPIFPAAHALKCIATGIEIDPTFYGLSVTRIQDLS